MQSINSCHGQRGEIRKISRDVLGEQRMGKRGVLWKDLGGLAVWVSAIQRVWMKKIWCLICVCRAHKDCGCHRWNPKGNFQTRMVSPQNLNGFHHSRWLAWPKSGWVSCHSSINSDIQGLRERGRDEFSILSSRWVSILLAVILFLHAQIERFSPSTICLTQFLQPSVK